MPTGTTERRTTAAPAVSPPARLAVHRTGADPSTVDGGWWPRSWDAAAELPGLVRALEPRFGPVGSVMLNRATWTGDFRWWRDGDWAVRVGWFATLDPALAVVTIERGGRLDLLVVPPSCTRASAEHLLGEAWRGTHALPGEVLAAEHRDVSAR